MRRKRKKRLYQYKPTTLTLEKLISLMETREVVDLTQFSNGERWFHSLKKAIEETRREVILPSVPRGEEERWWAWA